MAKKSRQNKSIPKQQQKPEQDKKIQQSDQEEQKFTLYLLLEVQKNATIEEIKKQYKKLVLKYHPDKNKQDPLARQKFQKLKQAYDILSDQQKRKLYDQTGSLGNQQNFDQKSFQSAYAYFRAMFKQITEQDIIQFQKKYRYGVQQEQDLIKYYEQNQGNMVQLIESIPLSTNQDIPRFIQFFEKQIKDKKLTKYKNFDTTKNKVKHLKDQTKQFEQMKKKQKSSINDLALAIRNKAANQVDFLAALEQKYGGNKKSKATTNKKKK